MPATQLNKALTPICRGWIHELNVHFGFQLLGSYLNFGFLYIFCSPNSNQIIYSPYWFLAFVTDEQTIIRTSLISYPPWTPPTSFYKYLHCFIIFFSCILTYPSTYLNIILLLFYINLLTWTFTSTKLFLLACFTATLFY